MHITIVLGPFQPMPPAGMGAVEKVWCDLAAVFAARGHEVTIVGRGGPGETGTRDHLGVRYRFVQGLDATGRIAIDLAKDLVYATRVVRSIPRSDIVVTNSFWTPVILTPLKRWKGRVVVHVARFPKGQMWLYHGVNALQAISSAVAQAIRRQTPSVSDKVRVLGYPVDLAVFSPGRGNPHADEGLPVVYVGRLHPEKGIHLLVEAFREVWRRVPAASLKIVGPHSERQGGGGEAYLREIRAASEGLPVSFPGGLACKEDLAEAYRQAACFCYPSVAERGEAFGLAVLEAMATGAPCVLSALECFQDFARHGENALVFDHRAADAPARLANAIVSVLDDREYASRIGKAACATAAAFSLDRIADEYLRMFENVLAA